MITEKTSESVDSDVAPKLKLIHIYSTCCPPFSQALCGKVLTPKHSVTWKNFGKETCVICVDLEKNYHFCPRCGKQLAHSRSRR